MWYVMQVQTGREKNVIDQCNRLIGQEVLQRCFVPCYEEMKRYQGSWKKERRILFPGYVFLVSDDIEELFVRLKYINGLTKLLGVGKDITPLTESEIRFLMDFGKEEQIVRISRGIIISDKVIILDGPLRGHEGEIRKIDRHKRKAWLEVDMFGKKTEIQVGVEIVSKQE